MQIEISGIAINLMRKQVKNLNLRIHRTGKVLVSAPKKMPMAAIYQFIHEKKTWITTHQERLQQYRQTEPSQLLTGDSVFFKGKEYILMLHPTESHQRVELGERSIRLLVKPNQTSLQRKKVLLRWYQQQMQTCLPALFHKWQTIMGVTVNKITIRSMKARWGSCHPVKKHITLNLHLIEKNMLCLEYVIVHELVHLFEPSHNKRFYRLMDQYLPDWRHIRKQLG